MANMALREAMDGARMTGQALARRVGVDEKTVSRWVASENRIPYPRHRWAVSEALGVDEHMLWPDALRAAVKAGPDREIAAVYAYRSALPASLWRRLITNAASEIMLAGYTNYFLWIQEPNFGAALRRKAAQSCKVKVLVGDPDSEVTRRREQAEASPLTVSARIAVTLEQLGRLRGTDGIEARFSDRHIALSVFRFDDDMIVTPHLANLVGHNSPAFHVRRHQDNGIFDRFAMHVRTLWDEGRDVWPGAAQAAT